MKGSILVKRMLSMDQLELFPLVGSMHLHVVESAHVAPAKTIWRQIVIVRALLLTGVGLLQILVV